eukprot:g33040.t1
MAPSRKKGGEHTLIYINGENVERVESVKFRGVTITDNLSWTSYVDATVKKAQQRLFFLWHLRKFALAWTQRCNFSAAHGSLEMAMVVSQTGVAISRLGLLGQHGGIKTWSLSSSRHSLSMWYLSLVSHPGVA